MTVYASDIIDDAEVILKDTDNTTWTELELFNWVSEGQQRIVSLKNNAYVTNGAVQLTTGVLQTITGTQVIKVSYNMGTDGATIGGAIQFTSMEILSRLDRDWTTATASATVEQVMFDPDDPTRFYVYPPQPSSDQGYVQIAQSVNPDDLVANSETPLYDVAIVLADYYRWMLLDFVLYKAFSVDAGTSQYAAQRAEKHLDLFLRALMQKAETEATYNPNTESNR